MIIMEVEWNTVVLLLCLVSLVDARAYPVVSMEQNEISIDRHEVNTRPIIGILTESTPHSSKKHGDEFILATYVKFLELAGARVVPIREKQHESYYKKMFNSLNGVLFPGGGVSIIDGYYYESGKYMYEMAIKANDDGDYFPIWGTCLGLELLSVLRLDTNILKDTDSSNATWPVDFVDGYEKSRLFQNMPQDLINYLQSEPVTQNNHRFSILLQDFKKTQDLNEFYQLLSTNQDKNGLEFVSTMEAKDYPIYAVQWHPEKNIFNWNTHYNIDHSFHAIQVTQYMANFFVSEARKSNHRFESAEDEAKALIENNQRVFTPTDSFGLKYYFNYDDEL